MKNSSLRFRYGGQTHTAFLNSQALYLELDGVRYSISKLPCDVRVRLQNDTAIVRCGVGKMTVLVNNQPLSSTDTGVQLYPPAIAAILALLITSGNRTSLLISLAVALAGIGGLYLFFRISDSKTLRWSLSLILTLLTLSVAVLTHLYLG
jgi:hypothetical protein